MSKTHTPRSVTVRKFYEQYGTSLEFQLISSAVGLDRSISEATINRPGLAMAGFLSYFADKRVQVFGSAEIAYLSQLPSPMRLQRLRRMCAKGIPCIVIAQTEEDFPPEILSVAEECEISVFFTHMLTMKFINLATIKLESELAESTTLHGCMVDMRGIGILIRGESGVGKSETAIGVIERGGCLVADDVVSIKNAGGELIAAAPKISQGYLEVRGLGFVDITRLFGMSALRVEKRLDLVVTLKHHQALNEVDRIGVERGSFEIMGHKVTHIELPVAPGRDSARLIEVAAMDHLLKIRGYDMAKEFSNRIFRKMNGCDEEDFLLGAKANISKKNEL